MARLGNIIVADRESYFESGGAFTLKHPAPKDSTVVLAAGDEVEVMAGSPYAVIQLTNRVKDAQEAFAKAFEAIHAGLTTIAAHGGGNLEIHKAFEEHLCWWREGGTQILRVSATSALTTSMTATITVRDSNGNVKPSDPVASPQVHESVDYFRRSQVSDSLFESFHQMWLALESLLSWRFPKQKEHEDEWLKRALKLADLEADLASHCSPKWNDFPKEFLSEIYKGVRLRTFHSKDGQRPENEPLSAHRIADRHVVQSSLKRLCQVLIHLYRRWLHVSMPTGGLTYYGFEYGSQWLDEGSAMAVSSCSLPGHADETLAGPGFRDASTFPISLGADESKPGLKMIVGAVAPSTLATNPIRRCGLTHENNLVVCHVLEDDLTLEGVDSFQLALGIRLQNSGPPKVFFSE